MTNSSPTLLPHDDKSPSLAADCRIAPNVVVVGDVTVGAEASLWWGVIIRGDDNYVKIGQRSNIQDGSIIHVTLKDYPTIIGDDVVVGHGARLHGCTVGDGALVGIAAIVLDGATIEPQGFLAAGSLLAPGKTVPSGELWAGNPAKKLRDLRPDDFEFMAWDAKHYVQLAKRSLPTVTD